MKLKQLFAIILTFMVITLCMPISIYAEDDLEFFSGVPEGELETDGYSWDGTSVLTLKNANITGSVELPENVTIKLAGSNLIGGSLLAYSASDGVVTVTSLDENEKASLTVANYIGAPSSQNINLTLDNVVYSGGISNGNVGHYDSFTIKNSDVTTSNFCWMTDGDVILENSKLTVDSYFWLEQLSIDDTSVINMNAELCNYGHLSVEDALGEIEFYLPVGYDIAYANSQNTIVDKEGNIASNIVLKCPELIEIPAQDESAVYNGTEQSYPLQPNEYYDVLSAPQTNANEEGSDVIISLKADKHVAWKDKTKTDITHKFKIAKAPANVKAVNKTIVIGGTVPDLSSPQLNRDYIVEGLFGTDSAGDTVTLKYQKNGADVVPDSSVTGTYDIVVSVENENSNYNVTCTNGTLTVSTPSSPGTGGGGGRSTKLIINYETNGGSPVPSERVIKNRLATEPLFPEKDGCTFEGWYEDEELTEKYDFTTPVTKSITLYAKWNEFGACIVDIDDTDINSGNGGSGHNCPSLKFDDLDISLWYHFDTDYVLENGIFKGTHEKLFSPDDDMTRAMMVTVLYRMEKEPAVNRSVPFADVEMDEYYANAVIWAEQNGITEGYSETEFAPYDSITREQIAAIMFRYAKFKGYDVSVGENTNILSYEDYDQISEYAIPAMQCAVGSGMIVGRTEATLNPLESASRVEIAAMLHRFTESNK